MIVLLLH